MWYAWEESGGPVHMADPTDANVNPVRAMTRCGKRVNSYEGWRLSQTKPARVECPAWLLQLGNQQVVPRVERGQISPSPVNVAGGTWTVGLRRPLCFHGHCGMWR